MSSVPKELGSLNSLKILSLSQNRLVSIPKELGKLANLSKLFLYGNQLESLPEELGALAKLTELRIQINKLKSVPTELGDLPDLNLLDISKNPDLLSPPPEVVKQGTHAILAYLREQQQRGERQWIWLSWDRVESCIVVYPFE